MFPLRLCKLVLALGIVIVPASRVTAAAQPAPGKTPARQTTASARPDDALLRRVREILREVPLIDGHNDTAEQYMERVHDDLDKIDLTTDTSRLHPPMRTDLRRLRAGCVGALFFAAYAPPPRNGISPTRPLFEQIDLIHRIVDRYSDTLEFARTADDIVRVHKSGKIAALIGVEGGHLIDNSLDVLRTTYDRGARYMTLTHSHNNDWADSATDRPAHGGLTPFGRRVVREMNRLGMLVDLSHVSTDTMSQALEVSAAPVIFSHSCARALCDVRRNVPDDILQRLAANGGIIMVAFVPEYISDAYDQQEEAESRRLRALYPNEPQKVREGMRTWWHVHPQPDVTISQVADHIDHIRKVAGIDYVGIGSDFDGFEDPIRGLEDVSCYPALFVELLRRGYSDEDLKKIAGLNFLRVLRAAELTSSRLRAAEH